MKKCFFKSVIVGLLMGALILEQTPVLRVRASEEVEYTGETENSDETISDDADETFDVDNDNGSDSTSDDDEDEESKEETQEDQEDSQEEDDDDLSVDENSAEINDETDDNNEYDDVQNEDNTDEAENDWDTFEDEEETEQTVSENTLSENSAEQEEEIILEEDQNVNVYDESDSNTDSNMISRLEWWEMLIDAFHMSVEEDNYPDNYYSDIDSSDSEYRTIMVATEFGLVDVDCGDEVDADGIATREFAAHTLNQCIGYFNQNDYSYSEADEVIYPDDIQVAIDHEWFLMSDSDFNPDLPVTGADYTKLKSVGEDSYEARLIDENYDSSFTLKSGVVNLGEIDAIITDDNEITVYGDEVSALSAGKVFVILYGGMPFAYRAEKVSFSGGNTVIQYSTVAADDVYDDVDVQAVKEVDLSDVIVTADGEEVQVTYIVGGTAEENFEDGVEYDNIENIDVEKVTAIRVLRDIPVKTKSTGNLSWDTGTGCTIKASITISNLKFKSSCNLLSKSASVCLSGEMKTNLAIKTDLSGFVPADLSFIEDELGLKITIGVVGYFKVSPKFDIGAELSLNMQHKFCINAWVEGNDFGLNPDFEKKEFTLNASIEAKIGLTAELGFDIVVFKGAIFAEIGIKASLKDVKHSDDSRCVDFSAYVYIEAGAYVKTDFKVSKGNFDIRVIVWDKKSSPMRVQHHYEDGTEVDECTRQTAEEKSKAKKSSNPNVRYGIYYTPVDSRYGSGGLNTGRSSTGDVVTIFEYDLDENGNAIIKKYNGNVSILNIPASIDDHEVVGINSKVFSNRQELVGVVISDTVTDIGNNAFSGCSNLQIVSLPQNLKSIGYRAFSECVSLTSIDIPKSLEIVSGNVNGFSYNGPFYNCASLTNVSFETGTTNICGFLFDQCTGVKEINVPDTVVSIGDNAFSNCSQLEWVHFPDSVTSIGKSAFANCTMLHDLTLPCNLLSLGKDAFRNCDSIERVAIPKSLENVKEGYCGGYVTGLLDHAGPFVDCDSLTVVEFEDGITKIPDYICAHCKNITKIIIPDSVTQIGTQSFFYCTELSELSLGTGVTIIGEGAFGKCSALSEINLPVSVTEIGKYAFVDCDGLTEVVLPSNLVTMRGGAFESCDNLKKIYIPKSLNKVNEIYKGGYSVGGCLNNSGPFAGCNMLTEVEFEEGTTIIADYLFAQCEGLESIEIPSTVKTIGVQSFDGCAGLKEISWGENLEEIKKAAFGNCTSLVELSIPETVTYMEKGCFAKCTSLESVHLPQARKNVVENMFQGCTSLKNVELPSGLEAIRSYAFEGCTALESIEIPENVSVIEQYAFKNCYSLKDIVIEPNDTLTIGDYAFQNCDKLATVQLSDGVTAIGKYCFDSCASLKNVDLGKGLKKIPQNSFSNCASLEEISLPYYVTAIESNAFLNDTLLKKIVIPRNTTSISTSAFSYKDRLVIYGVAGSYAESFANTNGYQFVVQDVPAQSVYFSSTTYTIYTGETMSLPYTIEPENTTDEINWVVSRNADKVSFTSDGVIKGLAITEDGNPAIVKLSVGDNVASCKIVVRQAVTSMGLNSTSRTMDAGTTYQLSASVYPSTAYDKSVVWSSSDENIAVVDENGLVTALGKGSCVITASAVGGTNISKSCTITVKNSLYIIDDVENLQSPHPYAVNQSDIWQYTMEGAERIAVTFSDDTKLEEDTDGDYIIVTNGDGIEVGKYYADDLKNKTIEVNGNTVRIQLVSDSINSKDYGFRVTDVSAIESGYVLGDINNDGKVNAADRIYLARYLAGWSGYVIENEAAADVNCDNKVNAADRIYLARYLAGWSGYSVG